MKAAEASKEPKSTVYPAFRFRKAIATDTEAERKAGYAAKLFNTAEDEQAAEDAEPGVHNWFNNPGLKEEKPNATVADVQNDMAAQIQQLTSDLESANATIGVQDKQLDAANKQIAGLQKSNDELEKANSDDSKDKELAAANKQIAKLTKDLEKASK